MLNRFLLTTTAALAAVTAAVIPSAPVQAYPNCSSFQYGIGHCVNQGWNNGAFQQRQHRYDDQRLLLEQPRFQPGFGGGYSPVRQGWGSSNW